MVGDSRQTRTYDLLINLLRDQKRRNSAPHAALLLGAGCSLSSSDKNITTTSLVRDFVQKYESKIKDGLAYTDLYQRFTNLKDRIGDEQFRLFFEDKLKDAAPGPGYEGLAKLVKGGFFRWILTTNFDLLLNDVLKDITHDCVIGPEAYGGDGTNPVLMKVHGDIRHGLLRFAPHELVRLPETLRANIDRATQGLVLVIGYSGQDLGLMDSLSKQSGYNAFLSTFDPLDEENSYRNRAMKQWLTARKSEVNILSGPELGDFDSLLERLAEDLLGIAPSRKRVALLPSGIPTPARPVGAAATALHSAVEQFPRLKKIMYLFSSYARDVLEKFPWSIKAPLFAASVDDARYAYLNFLRDGEFADALLRPFENEGDALLLLAGIEIKAWAAGLDLPVEEILDRAREEYDQFCSGYVLTDEFWTLLRAAIVPQMPATNEMSLKLYLNNHRRLTLTIDRVPLGRMRTLFDLLDAVAPIMTAPQTPVGHDGHASALLRTAVRRKEIVGGRLRLTLAPMTRMNFARITGGPLARLEAATADLSGGRFGSSYVELVCEALLAMDAAVDPDIYSALSRQAEKQVRRFLNANQGFAIPPRVSVALRGDTQLRNFLRSQKNACLLIGASGSGKTTILRTLLEDSDVENRPLFLVVSPKATTALEPGIGAFLPGSMVKSRDPASLLQDINQVMESRGRSLVLLLDGLNEIEGGEESLRRHYEGLLALAEILTTEGLKAIKLVITCRDATFSAHLNRTLPPDPECFFTEAGEDGVERAFVRVPELSRLEQDRLVDAFFPEHLSDAVKRRFDENRFLAAQFTYPYMIAIASRIVKEPDRELVAGAQTRLFAAFVEMMLERLDNAVRTRACNILHEIIHRSLKAGPQCWGLTRFQLRENINHAELENFDGTVNALCDLRILRQNTELGRVDFVHERMTEYFVGRYIYDVDPVRRQQVIEQYSRTDPVLIGGFRIYFDLLLRQAGADGASGAAGQLAREVPLLLAAPRAVSACFVGAMAGTPIPMPVRTELVRHILLNHHCGGIDQNFVAQVISRGGQELLGPLTAKPVADLLEAIIPVMTPCVATSHVGGLLLIQSQAVKVAGDLDKAEQLAQRARLAFTDVDDAALHDKVEVELAAIARDRGCNSEAMVRLQHVYDNQVHYHALGPAFLTGLELGAALRNDTQFDKALSLYASLWAYREEVEDHQWIGLLLDWAAVEKNELQRLVSEGDAVVAQVHLGAVEILAASCLDHLDKAKQLAERHSRFGDLITAASELAELNLVLFRLHRGQAHREMALNAMEEMERRLAFLPDVRCRIELCRYRASFAALEHRLDDAFRHVAMGRELALHRGMSFEATDCDYLVAHLAASAVGRLRPEDLAQGLAAAVRAIGYYEANVSPENKYLANVRAWEAILLAAERA